MKNTLSYPQRWSTANKIAFRLFGIYFMLYIFPFPLGQIPYVNKLAEWWGKVWQFIVPWVGENILQLAEPITTFTNGSGDTTYDYLLIPVMFTFALLGTIVWTILDKNRPNYNQLYYWLLVFLRYYLCFTLLSYGFAKTFKLQFPNPSLVRLLQPYGDSSPMGLAWTFMGYSHTYNWFTGLAEVIPGLLLLFRRTTLFGALMAMAVMFNIMMMNFSFDIPVKLYSTHLFLIGLFITVPHWPRIISFFFGNSATPTLIDESQYYSASWRRVSRIFKYVLIIGLLFMNLKGVIENQAKYGDKATPPPLKGIYEVETFLANGDTIPPLTTDTLRWKRLVLDGYGEYPFGAIFAMDDAINRIRFEVDSTTQTLTLKSRADEEIGAFNYDYRQEEEMFILDGIQGQDTLSIYCKIRSKEDFLLMNRGFHWINEFPFNR